MNSNVTTPLPLTSTEFSNLAYYDALCGELLMIKKEIKGYLSEHTWVEFGDIDVTTDPKHGFLVHLTGTDVTMMGGRSLIDPEIFTEERWDTRLVDYSLDEIKDTLAELDRAERLCHNIGVERIVALRKALHAYAEDASRIIERTLKQIGVTTEVCFTDETHRGKLTSFEVNFFDADGVLTLSMPEEWRSVTITADEIAADAALVGRGREEAGYVGRLLSERALLVAGRAKQEVKLQPTRNIRFDTIGNMCVPLGQLRVLVEATARD